MELFRLSLFYYRLFSAHVGLILRRHYCLAIRICDYWKIPKGEGASRILGHWACYKVSVTSGCRLAVTYM